jgi:methionine aminopeptidase
VLAACKPGAKVVDLCALGDATIEEEAGKFYNKKDKDGQKVEKGIAFPTCCSVNHQVCHNSPGADDAVVLEEGQAVKLDLGAHVDGYVATAAHTVVLMGDMHSPVTGVMADVMAAVVTAGEAAIRKLRPGQSTAEVGKAIERVAEDFGVTVVEGVLTHSMKRFVIDGNKVILNKPSPELKAEDEQVELNEVYALDIVMSSGEGKPKQLENRTTVFKRDLEQKYSLKMKTSRAFFSEVNSKFPYAARASNPRQPAPGARPQAGLALPPFHTREPQLGQARRPDPNPDPDPHPNPHPHQDAALHAAGGQGRARVAHGRRRVQEPRHVRRVPRTLREALTPTPTPNPNANPNPNPQPQPYPCP